ncbi:MAG: hypothetical protein IPM24_12420 [Bryobacterales bacterium]|nr:hypothetical protein [Bryobacterales bacterium]
MPLKRRRREGRRRQWQWLWALAPFAAVFASHALLLDLPLFWDELGYFVPAALDLFRHGFWIPQSVPPSAHPPGLSLYLTGVWTLTGYSIPATRVAMLLLAGASLGAVFLLAVAVCRNVRGVPALLAVLALAISPLFVTQSMLAQLDMPAMLWTTLAFLLFLRERHGWAAAVCVVLVLFRETGVIVPVIFALWLLCELRPRDAWPYVVAPAVLGVWFVILTLRAGTPMGNEAFASYNLTFLLHPVRAGLALTRRLYFLFFANGHWIGTLGLAFGLVLGGIYEGRAWRVLAVLLAAHILMFSLFGGAVLERYLLPVLPLLYIAMLAGWMACPMPWGLAAPVVLLASLLVANFWHPPFPFSYENNLVMVDFVHLQKTAVTFVESELPAARVASAWPATAAFRDPEFGYARYRREVSELSGFSAEALAALDQPPEVLVIFPRHWEAPFGLARLGFARTLWRRHFGANDRAGPGEIARYGLRLANRWSRGGQWIEVWVRGPDALQ